MSDSVWPHRGSPVPGILQARTLEWAAISFSNIKGRAHSKESMTKLCKEDLNKYPLSKRTFWEISQSISNVETCTCFPAHPESKCHSILCDYLIGNGKKKKKESDTNMYWWGCGSMDLLHTTGWAVKTEPHWTVVWHYLPSWRDKEPMAKQFHP